MDLYINNLIEKAFKTLSDFFSKHKDNNKGSEGKDESEFVFIWYKKMLIGNKTYYTQPFRTKVNAKSVEKAKDKLIDFAMSKMSLQIIEEKDFDGSEIMKLQKDFDKLNDAFDKITTDYFSHRKR